MIPRHAHKVPSWPILTFVHQYRRAGGPIRDLHMFPMEPWQSSVRLDISVTSHNTWYPLLASTSWNQVQAVVFFKMASFTLSSLIELACTYIVDPFLKVYLKDLVVFNISVAQEADLKREDDGISSIWFNQLTIGLFFRSYLMCRKRHKLRFHKNLQSLVKISYWSWMQSELCSYSKVDITNKTYIIW